MNTFHEPGDTITFLGDGHGDAGAYRTSLMKAGSIDFIGTRLVGNPEHSVVFLGDLFDRYFENMQVAELIMELREQMDVVLVWGNHDAMMHHALMMEHDHLAWFNWLNNGGITMLKEVADRKQLQLHHSVTGNMPFSLDQLVRYTVVSDEVAENFRQYWQSLGLDRVDLDAVLDEISHTFCGNGKYASIFHTMTLMAQVRKNVRAVHAGLNAYWAEKNESQANMELRYMQTKRSYLDPLTFDPHKNALLWRNMKHMSDVAFTRAALRMQKEQDTAVIVHGHDYHKGVREKCSHPKAQERWGTPLLQVRNGIGLMNADTGMSRGIKNVPNSAGYIQCKKDGSFRAWSEASGHHDFGRINEKGIYEPPNKK